MPRLLCAKAFTARPVPLKLTPRLGLLKAQNWRFLSSDVNATPRVEHINVPCRSNGFVKIDVFHSSASSSPIIIYLPSGPVLPDNPEEDERVISTLSNTAAATIVRINYRASPTHTYPTPYHDVLFGYDWIQSNLLRDEFHRPFLARMGVCGELIGGSLATMLALTECRIGESRIGAAAVNNPIVDWVLPDELPSVDPTELPEPRAPDETAFPADEDPMALADVGDPMPVPTQQKRSTRKPPLTAWQRYGDNTVIPALTMSAERDVLFRRPEDYFDRFASPIHFFRSPRAQLLYPQKDDMFASIRPDELVDVETRLSINHFASVNDESAFTVEIPTLTRCRAYARIFPLAGFQLSLPAWHVTTGTHSPLGDQATELVKFLRRSLARYTLKSRSGRTRWHDKSEKEMYEELAAEKIILNTVPNVGLWSQPGDKGDLKSHVENIGVWMKQQLDPGTT